MANVKRGDLVAAGVTKSTKKASMVDPKGAWTKVQERTLGKMQTGGMLKIKKGKSSPKEMKVQYEEFKKQHQEWARKQSEKFKKTQEPKIEGVSVGSSKPKAKEGKWIQKAIKKPGALRKQLGAKPGKPIPAGKLKAAAKKSGKIGQRARLAITLKKMKKK